MTSLQTIPPPSPPTSSWTFTQGFILGQASFLLIVLLFIRYVVFSPADAPNEEEWKQRRQERAKVSALDRSFDICGFIRQILTASEPGCLLQVYLLLLRAIC